MEVDRPSTHDGNSHVHIGEHRVDGSRPSATAGSDPANAGLTANAQPRDDDRSSDQPADALAIRPDPAAPGRHRRPEPKRMPREGRSDGKGKRGKGKRGKGEYASQKNL